MRLEAVAEVERRFAAIPGVRAVGATDPLPLGNENSRMGVAIEGREPTPDVPTRAHMRAVTNGFFEAMGMTLVSGRRVRRERPRQVAARGDRQSHDGRARYWPGASPVGKRVRLGGTQEWREVVGVLADARNWGLDRDVNPEMYLPVRQLPWTTLFFVVATDQRSPSPGAGDARGAALRRSRSAALERAHDGGSRAHVERRRGRSTMILLSVFGVLALVLAAAGIYGVMAHLVDAADRRNRRPHDARRDRRPTCWAGPARKARCRRWPVWPSG